MVCSYKAVDQCQQDRPDPILKIICQQDIMKNTILAPSDSIKYAEVTLDTGHRPGLSTTITDEESMYGPLAYRKVARAMRGFRPKMLLHTSMVRQFILHATSGGLLPKKPPSRVIITMSHRWCGYDPNFAGSKLHLIKIKIINSKYS